MKGLFDKIDHAQLLRALKRYTACEWVLLYFGRWLKAPFQQADGTLVQRIKGTPQGSVVNIVLANLFPHYAFDVWMTRAYPGVPWCRYADDGLVHCKATQEAQAIMAALSVRLSFRMGVCIQSTRDCVGC